MRIHSECLFGDVFGSMKCDCGPQLKDFLASIGDKRPGVLVYVKGHEGRGAGLWTKTRAYGDVDQHPEKHHNHALLEAGALQVDARTYDAAADFALQVMLQHGVASNTVETTPHSENKGKQLVTLVLHTNNPNKVETMCDVSARFQGPECEFLCKQKEVPASITATPSTKST